MRSNNDIAMADLLLIASVGIDRIWTLDGRLRPGARVNRRSLTQRFGGGGMNTGTPLARLGHRVRVAAVLRGDALGQGALAEMARRGLDASLMTVVPGETPITEILVEPGGERTLIFPAGRFVPRPPLPRLDAALVYVNAGILPPETDAALAAHPLVVAQFPHRKEMAHPAHVLIASRSDVPDMPPAEMFAWGRREAGAGLRALVITDGARPVTIAEENTTAEIPLQMPVAAADTTGAGDVFAAGLIDGMAGGLDMADSVRRGIALSGEYLAAGGANGAGAQLGG